MPRTPDRAPGPSIEEELQLDDLGADPTVVGGLTNNGGVIRVRDNIGVYDPRTGGGGISEAQHEVLDTLVHALSESSYTKHTYSGWRITNTTVWTTSGMTMRIREVQYTYTAWRVTGVVEIQYSNAGVEIQRLTHAYIYVGNKIDTITTTETP